MATLPASPNPGFGHLTKFYPIEHEQHEVCQFQVVPFSLPIGWNVDVVVKQEHSVILGYERVMY